MNKYDVCVLGGANLDISGTPYFQLKKGDSTPGNVTISPGGVGRNIAENLVRLGFKVALCTALGNDYLSKIIADGCSKLGIDISLSHISGKDCPIYMCFNDESGEMLNGISSMKAFDNFGIDELKSKISAINDARVAVLDTNLNSDALDYAVRNITVPIIIDPVSGEKAKKLRHLMGYIHTLKPNVVELSAICGYEANNIDDVKKCAHSLLERGLKRIFVSMGKEGVFYSDGEREGVIPSLAKKIVNTTGAGDAFTSAVVYGLLRGAGVCKQAKYGAAAATLCLEEKNACALSLSNDALELRFCELFGAV